MGHAPVGEGQQLVGSVAAGKSGGFGDHCGGSRQGLIRVVQHRLVVIPDAGVGRAGSILRFEP